MYWKLQENILEEKDIDILVDFIKTTKRFTQFNRVKEFEEAWSKWQDCQYSVFVNSGSSANLIIINLMKEKENWKDGDEIIVPAVTWVTNIAPVFQFGLKPVFVDVNLEDLSFDYDKLNEKITDRTRAIFITHLIGIPADINRIKEIIGSRNIKILEDCCESHGAEINSKKVGNFGDLSSFSFYWGHHMTTVEGGMVCTNDKEIYKQALLKRSHGLARELPLEFHDYYRNKYPDIDFSFLFLTDGFNFRNTELHAVLGTAQIEHLDKYNQIRKDNYQKFLKIIEPFRNHLYHINKEGSSPFCLPFLLRDANLKGQLQKKLTDSGIESRPIISGNLLRQPFLKGYGDSADFKNAEVVHQNGFYIGNNQFVDESRLGVLKDILVSFFAKI
ncbi:MAG: DegT/DnrJ/EryC1/StrS aminotransferase family protein [bacterium]|nr:DegT/DnrJ/EryC1/StrS aminotransferase family protein [bacterium]